MRRTTTGLLATLLLTGLAQAAPAHAAPPRKQVEVVAHRGLTTQHTENTLGAIAAALKKGADGVEIDVRLTRGTTEKPGAWLLMHDGTLSRTTVARQGAPDPAVCTGRVSEHTLAEIRANCVGREKGEPIPTLRQAARMVSKRPGAQLYLDMKKFSPTLVDADLARLREALVSQRMFTRSTAFSGDEAQLTRIHGALPKLRRTLIIDSRAQMKRVRRMAADDPAALRAWIRGVHLPKTWSVEMLRKQRKALGKVKVAALGRSANKRAEWVKYHRAGIGGFITDRTVAAVKWRG